MTVTGRSVSDVKTAHESLLDLWIAVHGTDVGYEEWFQSQLIDLPEVTDTAVPEIHHYDQYGAYLYSTWK